MKLWVDDERQPPGPDWVRAVSSAEALAQLAAAPYEELSLDHDLGGDDTSRAVVLWLCENPERWPPVCRVHSMNNVGRAWLTAMIYRYNPHYAGRR